MVSYEESCQKARSGYELSERLGLSFWIYPYEDHHILRVSNTVRRATPQEVEMWKVIESEFEVSNR
jgi:hypothetical protein